jgi:hypothetical protein
MPTPVKKSAAVIFSHGLGDTSAGWSFLAQQLGSRMPWVNWFVPIRLAHRSLVQYIFVPLWRLTLDIMLLILMSNRV